MSIDELLYFCIDGKTRQQIREKFDLTHVGSWSCSKFLKNNPMLVKVEKKSLKRKPSFIYTTRYFEAKRLRDKFEK